MMKLSISDLIIDFDTRYPEYVLQRCERYIAPQDSVPDLLLRASEEDIRKADNGLVSIPEAELYAMSIPLSDSLPDYDRMMMHGVALAYNGRSYVFTAESGVGKSTHAFLWQHFLGQDKVRIINGDKPIIRFTEETVCSCGTPWSGKEHLDENVSVPLGGICLLRRLESSPEGGNRISRATDGEVFDFLLHQIYIPPQSSGAIKTFRLLELLYRRVPFYNLYADISEEAFKVSFEKLVSG